MLRFSRPKGPGFGISADFYLSVLASQAVLPPLLRVINPTGEGGAATGFGVPLAPDATKDSLGLPLARGAYALASKDRKTVLKLVVVSKDEIGFDTEAVARHSESLGLEGEALARIRGTWTLLQLRFESHDPAVYPALDFVLALASRLAALTDGVVADPISQRYRLPQEVFAQPRVNPLVDAREHVAIHIRGEAAGVHAYTKGLQKFAAPELEIEGLEPGSEMAAESFLTAAAQSILEGHLLKVGKRIGPFLVREGGNDPGLWEGIPCFVLVAPANLTPSQALSPGG